MAYKEDADEVMSIIKTVWEDMAEDTHWGPLFISKTPSILRVNELGDSAIVIKVVGDTQAMQQWAVMGEFRRRIKRIFDQKGIEIPWPHTKVYFGDVLGSIDLIRPETIAEGGRCCPFELRWKD